MATGLSTYVGSVTGRLLWLHLLMTALWGMAAGLTVSLGVVPSVAALQATVALLVFGRFALGPVDALRQAALVAAGGMIQTVLAATLRTPGRLRGERRAVAGTFLALAQYARQLPTGAVSLPAAQAVLDADAALGRSWAAPGSPAGSGLRSLIGEAARMRLELVSVADARSRLAASTTTTPVVRALDTWLVAAARGLDALAARVVGRAVTEVSSPPPLPDVVPAAADRTTRMAWWLAQARTEAFSGQLRGAAQLQSGGRRGRPQPPGELRAALHTLRATVAWSSSTFRHGLRLAVLLPIAAAVAHGLAARRGYWVPVTALLVLKPDFTATVSRGVARVAGTAAGVVVASLVADGLHPRGVALAVLVALLAYGAFAFFPASYAVFAVFITAEVVLLISVADPQPLATAADRLLDTVVGGALAFAAYLAWPTWEGARLADRLAGLLEAQRRYAACVLDALREPSALDPPALRRAGAAATLARANADTSLERSGGEPRARRGDVVTARRVLAAARRLVVALHALASVASGQAGPLPEMQPLAQAVDTAFESLVTALRAQSHEVLLPPLRRRHEQMCRALGAGPIDGDEPLRRTLVISELDELVDALNSVAAALTG